MVSLKAVVVEIKYLVVAIRAIVFFDQLLRQENGAWRNTKFSEIHASILSKREVNTCSVMQPPPKKKAIVM